MLNLQEISDIVFLSNLVIETPSGSIDGVNKDFYLTSNPQKVIFVSLSGVVQTPNILEYSLIDNKIIFAKAPKTGMQMLAGYIK